MEQTLIKKQFTIIYFLIQLAFNMFEANKEKFIEYCTKNKLSACQKGNQFEVLCLEIMRTIGFTIQKTEAQIYDSQNRMTQIIGDNGIDLQGFIKINEQKVKVIVQCKCYEKSQIRGEMIQSLDNVISQYPDHIG